jgi:hypothetical protein
LHNAVFGFTALKFNLQPALHCELEQVSRSEILRKLKKRFGDRRASLDEETEIKPAIRKLVETEFRRGATVPIVLFPKDASEVPDSPRLTLVILEAETEWTGSDIGRRQIAEWTKQRGKSSRLYPAALVWCLKKPGRDLHEKTELCLAWKRVAREVADGTLGPDYDRADRAEITAKVTDAEEAAKDEVWGGYRFVVTADARETDGLKIIDLGAGHASASETLSGRMVTSLRSQELLNESVGAGYLDRNWPRSLTESGAWPLSSLRQSFLDGSLTRLLDPDTVLRGKIVEFVGSGVFGLASGSKPSGGYDRVWFSEVIAPDEVMFDANVFLLTKARARAFKSGAVTETGQQVTPTTKPSDVAAVEAELKTKFPVQESQKTIRITGTVPPETWNRIGTKLLPKLKSGKELKVDVGFSISVDAATAPHLESEIRQILEDLGLVEKLKVELDL